MPLQIYGSRMANVVEQCSQGGTLCAAPQAGLRVLSKVKLCLFKPNRVKDWTDLRFSLRLILLLSLMVTPRHPEPLRH